jgi:hypothetical protein
MAHVALKASTPKYTVPSTMTATVAWWSLSSTRLARAPTMLARQVVAAARLWLLLCVPGAGVRRGCSQQVQAGGWADAAMRTVQLARACVRVAARRARSHGVDRVADTGC